VPQPDAITIPQTPAQGPAPVPHHLRHQQERRRQDRHLAAMSRRLWEKPAGAVVKLGDLRVRITDGPNAYMQYKDVFVRGIYRFTTDNPEPLIIDGGGNMGLSILGFKRDHPRARVLAFEPDVALCSLIRENLERNGLADGVEIIEAGLAGSRGTLSFASDGSAGGQISAGGTQAIRVEPLSAWLDRNVDFVKLNIEGQELDVLAECEASGKLRQVERFVIEYHGWAGGPQKLGDLLNLLDRNGYRYLLHDFDAETCGVTKPPFRHRPHADWFCLVFAQRI